MTGLGGTYEVDLELSDGGPAQSRAAKIRMPRVVFGGQSIGPLGGFAARCRGMRRPIREAARSFRPCSGSG